MPCKVRVVGRSIQGNRIYKVFQSFRCMDTGEMMYGVHYRVRAKGGWILPKKYYTLADILEER